MKKLLLFFFLIYCSKSFALNLEELRGCYKTVQINGVAPANGPIEGRNQTRSEDFEGRIYTTLSDHKLIDINVLTFFVGFDDPYYSYSPFIFLKDLADKIVQEEDYFFYEIDTDINMSSDYSTKKVDHYLRAEFKRVKNIIQGNIKFVSNQRKINREIDFVLKEQECIEYLR